MARTRLTLIVGALLLIGAAAGFVVVPEHHPLSIADTCSNSWWGTPCPAGIVPAGPTSHLSRTAYDALRMTTWAFLIVGAVLVAAGLVSYARRAGPMP
jgi:disulfide bond formation protein DsbB